MSTGRECGVELIEIRCVFELHLLKIRSVKFMETAVIQVNVPKFVRSLEVVLAQFDKQLMHISDDGESFVE